MKEKEKNCSNCIHYAIVSDGSHNCFKTWAGIPKKETCDKFEKSERLEQQIERSLNLLARDGYTTLWF